MKRPFLLTAASLLAIGATNVSDQADALPLRAANPAEAEAYRSAVASGSIEELQKVLAKYPASPFAGNVFGELVQKVKPERLDAAPPARLWQIYNDDINQDGFTALIPYLTESREALRFTQAAKRDLQFDLSFCLPDMPLQRLKDCLAEALEDFAEDLEDQELNLAEPLRNLPEVVRQAAAEVRAAPTVEAARAAVAPAVVEVRRTIELLEAGTETVATNLQVRTGEVIASALVEVDTRLEEAVGL